MLHLRLPLGQALAFELRLGEFGTREPGRKDHASDTKGREKESKRLKAIKHGQIAIVQLGYPYTQFDGVMESTLSISYSCLKSSPVNYEL